MWLESCAEASHDCGGLAARRALTKTGNLAAVMKTMGHRDVRAAMLYQHPELELVRAASIPQSRKRSSTTNDGLGTSVTRCGTQTKNINPVGC